MENNPGIHPAPAEFDAFQLSVDPILHFFHYAHLPPALQRTSQSFFWLAHHVVNTLPRNAERTVALRKLLEAKDAAVRANLPAPTVRFDVAHGIPKSMLPVKEVSQAEFDRMIGEPVETGGYDKDRDGPIPFDG